MTGPGRRRAVRGASPATAQARLPADPETGAGDLGKLGDRRLERDDARQRLGRVLARAVAQVNLADVGGPGRAVRPGEAQLGDGGLAVVAAAAAPHDSE